MIGWRTTAIALAILSLAMVIAIQQAEAESPIIVQYIQAMEFLRDEPIKMDLEDIGGSPVFDDPDGDNLTYGFVSDGKILVSTDGSKITFQPAPGFYGSSTGVIIWAEDGKGGRSENMTLFFTVLDDVHTNPEVTVFEPNITSVTTREDTPITFRVLEVSEFELGEWSFAWRIDGVVVVGLDSPEIVWPEQSDLDGVYNYSGVHTVRAFLEYREDDCGYTTVSPEWTLTVVDANRPPNITYCTNDQVMSPGNDVHLQAVAYDPDWENMTYRWFHSRDKTRIEDIGKGSRVVLSRDLDPGNHYFRCEVSDGKDKTVSKWVTITIMDGTPHSRNGTAAILVVVTMVILIVIARRLREHSNPY
jgi:hypothetical protein